MAEHIGIQLQVSHVDHVLIHYEPQRRETSTCAVPLSEDITQITEHFGSAPYIYNATQRERDGTLLSEAFHHNPFSGEEKGTGIKVSECLLENEWMLSIHRKDS